MIAVLLWILLAAGCLLLAGVVLVLGARRAFPLPRHDTGAASVRIAASADTRLGAAILPLAEAHPGLSGALPLNEGRDAFGARVLLAREAQATIDAQYYIWQMDTTGWLMLDALRQAAERGVRVRLLLDDNGIPGLDPVLAALDALPNFEVRIFNPFNLRRLKLLSYAFDFARLNRRMHNKSFTVDGVVSIVGGRNIGDIYFGFGEGLLYFDLDVLVAGPAADAVSADFDAYWSSASAYRAGALLAAAPDGAATLIHAAGAALRGPGIQPFVEGMGASTILGDLARGEASLDWVKVQVVSDSPLKALGKARAKDLLIGHLLRLIGEPEHSLDVVSAYFIPGPRGARVLTRLARRGIRVRVLTNAQESNDVPLVHSGYIKYRSRLLRAGVRLMELRLSPASPSGDADIKTPLRKSSLHSKTIAIDRARIFVGSFNFDPRSAQLNTEMGLMVDSARIAGGLSRSIDVDGARIAYSVMRSGPADLRWTGLGDDGRETEFTSEPGTTLLSRAGMRALSWLPVEWLL